MECPTLSLDTPTPPDIGTMLFATSFFSTLLDSQCELIDTASMYSPDAAGHLLHTYDFVVVGAGSAGSVIAARLSENPDWKVLLVEAGTNPPLISEVPALFPNLLKEDSPYDWNYVVEKQESACLGTKDGRCPWPRGKMLGGSGGHNVCAYVRGRRRDYDYWAELGNSGWSYEDVLPYFKKCEGARSDRILSLPRAREYHGTEGGLTVILADDSDLRLLDDLKRGAASRGYQHVLDTNRDSDLGFTTIQLSIRNGTRCSSAKAFLSPARNRQNLHVVRNTLATKVLIDVKSKTAEGVRLLLGQTATDVKAAKEVVLSAGSTSSPQLLMLSGVGPRNDLKELGISPVVADLKVGHNLMDHIIYYGLVYAFERSPDNILIPDFRDAVYEYLKNRTGPLASIGYYSYVGFVKTKLADQSYDEPDIQIIHHLLVDDESSLESFIELTRMNDDIQSSVRDLVKDYDLIMTYIVLLKPRSVGRISLRNDDPVKYPRIDPQYFSDPRDVDTLVEGVQIAADIGRNVPGVKMVTDIRVEQCRDYGSMTREYWRCSLPYLSMPGYHSAGTCVMGPQTNPSAVVDHRLRVYGVDNLRVGDASVMPYLPSGNTNAATVMVGEKLADMIKEDRASR